MNGFGDKVSFIWSVADLLRGPYKPAQYGRVILPLTVLRRLDCVLEPTKAAVLAKHASLQGGQLANIEPVLNHTAKQAFHNTSKLDFPKDSMHNNLNINQVRVMLYQRWMPMPCG